MDLRRADRGRFAAVNVTLQVADRVLPRREIAKRNMHVRVDKAGYRHGAIGIDNDIACFHLRG
jgi:hypothetical protein